MEYYRETWDGRSIRGVALKHLKLYDGKVVLSVRFTAFNYREADTEWTTFHVDPAELRDFIAGLTVFPQGIGNGPDAELIIAAKTRIGKVLIPLDDDYEFYEPYVYWTEDGHYANEELDSLQSRVNQAKPVNNLLDETRPFILAMSIDGYITLFKRRLPRGFLMGLAAFQELTHTTNTYVVKEN